MRLSIVIAAWNGKALLDACLASLLRNEIGSGDEIIVPANFDCGALAEQFPRVRFLPLPPAATVPELRTAGIRASTGEIVAITEDHFLIGEEWTKAIRSAHPSIDSAGIGGAIENSTGGSALDWAVYLDDYGPYMLPLRSGPASGLSGANASYKRAALVAVEPSYRDGFFEPFVHAEMLRRGLRLSVDPAPVVYHHKTYRTGKALADAYHHGRGYGARRAAQWSAGRRLAFAAGCVILPILLPLRVVFRTIAKGRNLGALFRAIPYLIALRAAWAFGEMRGYLAGEGSSAGQWR